MYGGKYSKVLTVLLVIIIIAVIGLLGYVGYNAYMNHSIQKSASDYVEAFEGEKETTTIDSSGGGDGEAENQVGLEDLNIESSQDTTQTKAKRKVQYKGFDTVGTIQIPATNANYPVLAKTTKKSLETSVAVLYPDNAELNQEGNVVIVGHNYRNGTFFSNNKKLKIGDKINITDLYGKKITYIIYNIFEANQNDTSFYNRDTNGAKEITLSTCTDASNDMRLIIEAKEQ